MGAKETAEREREEYPLEELASLPEFYHPVVSPDKEKIAFYWDESGRNELYVMDVETGETEQLSDGEVPRNARWFIMWNNSSDKVFFHKDDAGDEQNDIYAIDLDGNVEEVITAEGQCVLQDSNDEYLLFTSSMEEQMNLYRYSFETGETEKLTEYEQPVMDGLLSPDGERVAYVANESDNLENSDVYVANADGTEPRNLGIGEEGYEASIAAWSSDSESLLIYDNTADMTRPGIYNLKDDEVEWFGSEEHEEVPVSFTPDEDAFIGIRIREAAMMPVVYGLDGGTRELDLDEGVSSFAGTYISMPGNNFTSDSDLVVGHTTPETRKELLHYDLDTDSYDVLIEAEYGDIDPDSFVDAEYITYESFDGLEIGALLYDSGERPSPGVVLVHGGPHSQSLKSFDLYTQFLVNRGYTVLQPNYRGSTGRGREFKNMIHNDWGGGELEDIAKAGEWLKERDWIDEDRVAVYGGSYGGYSVYMQMVKKPKLWSTGIASVGITDLHKMYEESMPHFQTTLEQQMGDPEEDYDLWRERSAIEHVENIERPILMIHGVNDPRCPVTQARIFRDALEEMGWEEGKDFEYEELTEEGHGSTDQDQKIRKFKILEDYLSRRL